MDRRALLSDKFEVKLAPYIAEQHYYADAIPGAKQLFSVVQIGELRRSSKKLPSVFQQIVEKAQEVEPVAEELSEFVCEEDCALIEETPSEIPLASREILN